MKRRVLIATLFIVSLWAASPLYASASNNASSPAIELYFPHFAGYEYDFFFFQGMRSDTIQRGTIGEDGRLTLTVPEDYKAYAGMGRWLLKKGGGLSFIVNGEDFSISCIEAMPNDDNITYQGSPENDFLNQQYFKQQAIFQKIDALRMLREAYEKEPKNSLYKQSEKEIKKQIAAFDALTRETINSPLYAARYRRISDFYNGLPLYNIGGGILSASALTEQEAEENRQKERRQFAHEELSMDALYTTGLWNSVITQMLDLYEDKKELGELMVKKLEGTKNEKAFMQLANDLISIVEKQSWEDAEAVIVDYLKSSGRVPNPQGMVYVAFERSKARPGKQAPVLECMNNAQFTNKQGTIVVFYETDCDNCDREMAELVNHYESLKAKGYEIISVSADLDKEIFQGIADTFPWQHKYCDEEGLDGNDFRNYGVIGTPTFYLIDSNGVILKRHSRLQDIVSL